MFNQWTTHVSKHNLSRLKAVAALRGVKLHVILDELLTYALPQAERAAQAEMDVAK